MQTKPAGADCPTCGDKPAEFKGMTDKFMRWRCSCGAEGQITTTAPPPSVKPVLPHWTTRPPAPSPVKR